MSPLADPAVRRALSIAFTALAALPALFLLLRAVPTLSRDARRLHGAIRALGSGEVVQLGNLLHREFADCAQDLEATAISIRAERAALQENAFRDALTELPNRRPFMDNLVREASAAIRGGRPLSLMMADLDHFKVLNDTYGHQVGDRVLKHVAGRFSNLVRQSDMVARFGGEEFSILLPGTDLATAMEIANQLRNALRSDPIVLDGDRLRVSASFGVSEMLECQISDPDHLLHQADMALYEAKRQGRDRVVGAPSAGASQPSPSDPMPAPARERALGPTALDQDTLALMGCTFSVLQVMPDKHRVMRDMMQQVASVLQCERVSLWRLDEEEGVLIRASSLRRSSFESKAPVPLPDPLWRWIAASPDATTIEDLRAPVFIPSGLDGRGPGTLYLPVAEYDDVLGVIMASDLPPDLEISARQRTILDAICAIGASALKSCEVYARIEKHWLGSVEALCAALVPSEGGKEDHLARVSNVCVEIARHLGMEDREQLQLLRIAAYLYDIGKVNVPRELLEKKGKLRASELETIRDHCRLGAAIVRTLPGLESLARIVLHHHERFDGTGYPEGLSGDAIPLESRILAVVDAYEAMTSERPYRRALSPRKALDNLMEASGTQFDPLVVAAFLKTHKEHDEIEGPIVADSISAVPQDSSAPAGSA